MDLLQITCFFLVMECSAPFELKIADTEWDVKSFFKVVSFKSSLSVTVQVKMKNSFLDMECLDILNCEMMDRYHYIRFCSEEKRRSSICYDSCNES